MTYYNLLVDVEDHPDPTEVLDQAAKVDAPRETRVEKRGPGQWQFSKTVEIELVSREDGQVILDIFDAAPVQIKALISLIFQAGPSVIQIENDDGETVIVSTDPDIPPSALENGIPLSAFLATENARFDTIFQHEKVQGREDIELNPTREFLLSLEINTPAERPIDIRFYVPQENLRVESLYERVFFAPYFTKLDSITGYATYRHLPNDVGITVEGVLFEEGWYHDILVSVPSEDDVLDDVKSKVVAALNLAGVREVFLEMDNDGESDVVPVWPVAIIGSELKQGPLRQFKLDTAE
ncbi:hypothetical protein [Yoonia sp. 2307UL14-13]|uniref:hypothetical protein n=1 Tax=Yoonia sp. 2307UL14-13 TaxID=3126506 RepID=UPI0030B36629